MDLSVRGKNLEITPALQSYVEKHTGKVQRYFEKPLKMSVLLRISNMTKTCEVTVYVDGMIIRGVEKSDDMYKSIDCVFDKVERQIHKYKTRLARRFRGKNVLSSQLTPGPQLEPPEFEIVKHKHFSVKPMDPEEAILQMNLLEHNFFVFSNSETGDTAVIYRRDDGKYGIIETE